MAEKTTETDEQRLARQNAEIDGLTQEHIANLQGLREQFAAHPQDILPHPLDAAVQTERNRYVTAAQGLIARHLSEVPAASKAPVTAKQKE